MALPRRGRVSLASLVDLHFSEIKKQLIFISFLFIFKQKQNTDMK